jgi:predicted PurR-regulated permease PerM
METSDRWGPFPRWAGALLGAGLLGLCFYELRSVLSPIFLALGIAYLLDPLVDRFEARGVPRGAAITIVLAILGAVITLFLLLVLPGMVREVVHFLGDLPGQAAQLVRRIEPWLAERNIPIPHDLDEALSQLAIEPAELARHAAAPAQAIVGFVLGGTVSAIGVVARALIVPVLAFYLLYDFDRMTRGAADLVPPRIRPWVLEVAREIDVVLGQFVRGQLLVMTAMGLLYATAYSLVGVRLAVPIGMIAGLLAFIPYVGSGSALAMGLTMCVVDWTDWWKPLWVVVAYVACQTLEGFVIIPRVVGDKVGLPAVWVLVALMIGGEVFGFLGVLLAVPVAAVMKIFVIRGLRWYRQSALYREGQGVERVAELVAKTDATGPIAAITDLDTDTSAPLPPAEAPMPLEPPLVVPVGSGSESGSESESESGSGTGTGTGTGTGSGSASGSDPRSAATSAVASPESPPSRQPTPSRPPPRPSSRPPPPPPSLPPPAADDDPPADPDPS